MSANPRIVLTGIYVQWDRDGTLPLFTKRGTVVDVVPGSALEAAYGGAGNLSPVIPAWDKRRAPEFADAWSKAALSN